MNRAAKASIIAAVFATSTVPALASTSPDLVQTQGPLTVTTMSDSAAKAYMASVTGTVPQDSLASLRYKCRGWSYPVGYNFRVGGGNAGKVINRGNYCYYPSVNRLVHGSVQPDPTAQTAFGFVMYQKWYTNGWPYGWKASRRNECAHGHLEIVRDPFNGWTIMDRVQLRGSGIVVAPTKQCHPTTGHMAYS